MSHNARARNRRDLSMARLGVDTLCVLLAGTIVAVLVWLPALFVYAESSDDRVTSCLACHGANGQSVTAGVPSLGGQPEFYLTVQLLMFRDKLRVNEPMNLAMQGRKDDDLRFMAGYFAKLPPPESSGGPIAAGRIEHARALIEQHTATFAIKEITQANRTFPDWPASAKTIS